MNGGRFGGDGEMGLGVRGGVRKRDVVVVVVALICIGYP